MKRRLRVSSEASADIDAILAVSEERWGDKAALRYEAVLQSTMKSILRAPFAPTTRERDEIEPGLRSIHTKTVRKHVKAPVHVIYYRVGTDVIDVLRVLHVRMNVAGQLLDQ